MVWSPACTWSTFGIQVLLLAALFELASSTPTTRQTPPVWDKRTGKEIPLEEIAKRFTRRTEGGVHLPIVGRQVPGSSLERRASSAAIGLGDYVDVAYSVLLAVGGITTPLILDTGSSDLWVMSDACTSGCGKNIPLYPQATFQPENLDAKLFYGDSSSGTSAFGEIGMDTVGLAGIALKEQSFAAINRTNTSISRTGSAGIFGLGFPTNSVIWSQLFSRDLKATQGTTVTPRENAEIERNDVKYGNRYFPNLHFHSRFPSLPDVLTGATSRTPSRRQISNGMLNLLASFNKFAPFIPRLIVEKGLSMPLFTVTLQRNTVDVGGNLGQLTIGEMPSGMDINELTWVPVRNYSFADGGLPAPPDSPNEKYPIAWEVLIDDVYLDGEKLPRSNLSLSSLPDLPLSALVDTGNSLIRGPEDVVQHIFRKLEGSTSTSATGRFKCAQPHTLAFSIGGKLFPVDPRDFATQVFVDDVSVCGPNLVPTDPPQSGGYLFSWSLGAPFLKSVLSAYYFGNLTYPSRDPPRMGFLSTVPNNANELLQSAVSSAAKFENFPMLTAPAPTGTATAAGTVSPSSTSTRGSSNAALPFQPSIPLLWSACAVSLGLLVTASIS
ncbi:aspartic peptidase domain-containing protein [Ephemerocybe angulata]|uniref:Aspartic peptidase domain-containing protein n=1 Tax=Ephemerocybe angulata TaxID=980116 RepID=A0A8H6IA39_9AGAR|nr:aspartic peptidase domain-containing protein [Tulosesus angulatus]